MNPPELSTVPAPTIKCHNCGKEISPLLENCPNCKANTPLGYAISANEPFIATLCQIVAWGSLVIGAIVAFFAVADIARPGYVAGVVAGFALIFSSIFWFAIGRVILLLARIAYNTRP